MILSKNQLKGLTVITIANALLLMSFKEEKEILKKLEEQQASKKKIKQYKDIIATRKKAIDIIYNIQEKISKQFPRKWVVLQKKRVDKYNKLFAKSFNLLPLHKRVLKIDDKEIYTELDYVVKLLLDMAKNKYDYNPEPQLHILINTLLNHQLSHYPNMDEKHKEAVKKTVNSFYIKIENQK